MSDDGLFMDPVTTLMDDLESQMKDQIYTLTEISNPAIADNEEEHPEEDITDNEPPDTDTKCEEDTVNKEEGEITVVDDVEITPVADLELQQVSFFQELRGQQTASLPPLESTPELDSKCKKWLSDYEETKTLPPLEDKATFLKFINRQRVNALMAVNYGEAAKFTDLLHQIPLEYDANEQNEDIKRSIESLEQKIQEIDDSLMMENRDMAMELKEEERKYKDKKDELSKKHEIELEEFEAMWNDEEYLKRFAKPSNKLLELKAVEHSMLMNEDYNNAGLQQQLIAKLEEEESENAQKRARKVMEAQYHKIQNRQDSEMEVLESGHQLNITTIKNTRDSKMELLKVRRQRTVKNLEDLKKGRVSSTLRKSKQTTGDACTTPRTNLRYSCFKATRPPPKVTVKPLGAILKKPRSSISRF